MTSIKINRKRDDYMVKEKKEYAECLKSAREFARLALESDVSSVVIQNAHKAVEFALSAYAIKKNLPMPRDHWECKNFAYKINSDFGKDFAELFRMYLGAYRLEDGIKAKRAKALMKRMLQTLEAEKHVGETLISNE